MEIPKPWWDKEFKRLNAIIVAQNEILKKYQELMDVIIKNERTK